MSVQTEAVNATEIIHVKTPAISCDGGGGPLGHPRIYLRITGTQIACPYCSRIYVLDEGAADDSH